MQSPTTRRRLLAGGAGATLAALAGCTGMTPLVGQRLATDLSLAPDGADRLAVSGRIGTITVVGEDRTDVDVHAVKQSSSLRTDLEDLSIETAIRNGRLEIRAEFDGETGWLESEPMVDLTVRIPETLAVDRIETAVGGATVRNVTGTLEIESTTGSIDVEDVDGSVTAESTTGRIAIADVTGTVHARATTGRIEVRDVGTTGDLTATTGRIEADVATIDGDTTIRTQTGRIEVAIDPDIDAELSATSSTGRVTEEGLPVDVTTSDRNALVGTLGAGGPTVTLETQTGRITLTALD